MLTPLADATTFKLPIYDQYIHGKSWLLWANLKRKISALPTDPHSSGPRATDVSATRRFSEARRSRPQYFLRKASQTLTKSVWPLVHPDFGVLFGLDLLQVGYSYVWHTKHAADPGYVAHKRPASIPGNTGTQEEFKQLFLSKLFWQSLKNKKKFFPPTHLSFSSRVNSKTSDEKKTPRLAVQAAAGLGSGACAEAMGCVDCVSQNESSGYSRQFLWFFPFSLYTWRIKTN